MRKIGLFRSSVENGFLEDRRLLFEHLILDPLLGKLFEPFLFELLPSIDQIAEHYYRRDVESCSEYLGLLAKNMDELPFSTVFRF